MNGPAWYWKLLAVAAFAVVMVPIVIGAKWMASSVDPAVAGYVVCVIIGLGVGYQWGLWDMRRSLRKRRPSDTP